MEVISKQMIKIAIVVGTRPEIIKMSPIIQELTYRKIDYFIIHTGQHYYYFMDKIFFEQLKILEPKYNLEVGSGTHAEQIGKMLIELENVFIQERPDIILVEGDTNSVFAAALAASKLHIKIGHVEAGLRSYNKRMPEELNRIMVDHMSDILFAPTEKSKNNLLNESVTGEIIVTGNTIVDVILNNKVISDKYDYVIKRLNLKFNNYILITLHRPESVDNIDNLNKIIESLNKIIKIERLPLIFPIHPRTLKKIKEFNIKIPEDILIIDPVGFLEFIYLERNARLIITDSGGIQEEACILKTPCITIREETERPETIEIGANVITGYEPNKIVDAFIKMINKKDKWDNPFGNGTAAKQIVDTIIKYYKK